MQAVSNAVATNNQGGPKGSNAAHMPWVGDNMGALVTKVSRQVVGGMEQRQQQQQTTSMLQEPARMPYAMLAAGMLCGMHTTDYCTAST
jgi:hypothetical protein